MIGLYTRLPIAPKVHDIISYFSLKGGGCLIMGRQGQSLMSPPRESCASLLKDLDQSAEWKGVERDRQCIKSCLPSVGVMQSWLVSLLICGRKNKPTMRNHLQDSGKVLLWRLLTSRRRQMVRGIKHGANKKRIDFSYDESSYAKNFDMGFENWAKNDPCFKIEAPKEEKSHSRLWSSWDAAQVGTSHELS